MFFAYEDSTDKSVLEVLLLSFPFTTISRGTIVVLNLATSGKTTFCIYLKKNLQILLYQLLMKMI